MILASDLGIVRKHCRKDTSPGMLGTQVRRTRAEATIFVQRKTAAVLQDRKFVHTDAHAPLIPARQLRPRAQANDRAAHKVNASATSPTGGSGI